MKRTSKKPKSADEQLAYHVNAAEDHLIAAVQLFTEHKQLSRPTGYFTRLVNVQEMVGGLNRQELVRQRGFQREVRKNVAR